MPAGSALILPPSFGLERRLRALRDLPRSDAFASFRRDVRQIVTQGHRDTLLAGKDGMGRPMAALKFNTIRSRKGSGPPLVPHGEASRLIANFDTLWYRDEDNADGTVWVLERRILGSAAKFAPFFISGTENKDGSVRMPKRDFSQIAPMTWAKIIARQREFMAEIGRGDGGGMGPYRGTFGGSEVYGPR